MKCLNYYQRIRIGKQTDSKKFLEMESTRFGKPLEVRNKGQGKAKDKSRVPFWEGTNLSIVWRQGHSLHALSLKYWQTNRKKNNLKGDGKIVLVLEREVKTTKIRILASPTVK